MSTWGWQCLCAECPSRADGGRQRYRNSKAAEIAARGHSQATGHATRVVEYR